MTLTSLQKFIFVVFLLALLSGLGYFLYNGIVASSIEADVVTETQIISQDILGLEARLNSIDVDSSFLTSSVFLSLTDQVVPLTAEPKGRPNPFAEIGSDTVLPR